MRDSYVFNAPNRGTAVQWCRMGDGNIGMEDYIRKYVAQCPGAAVSLEVIVSNTPRVFNYRDPQAWAIFQTTPAWEFARFLALCDRGVPRELPPPGQGRGGGGGGGRGQAQPGAGGRHRAGSRRRRAAAAVSQIRKPSESTASTSRPACNGPATCWRSCEGRHGGPRRASHSGSQRSCTGPPSTSVYASTASGIESACG